MLDRAISSAQFRLSLLEKALHDPGPWSITVADRRCEARRVFYRDGVSLLATVPGLAPGADLASLWCGDDLVGVRAIEIPADVDLIEVDWTLQIDTAALAS